MTAEPKKPGIEWNEAWFLLDAYSAMLIARKVGSIVRVWTTDDKAPPLFESSQGVCAPVERGSDGDRYQTSSGSIGEVSSLRR